jgi:hypothetical protein
LFNRKPKPISALLQNQFSVEKMGTGMKRGMVLRIAPAKLKEVLGRDDFRVHVKRMKLTGKDDNPTLIIETLPGTAWRMQIHQVRYQLKQKINARLKCEFIKDVRVY